ncbi:MAG: Tol-Pal system beta propeller repeat protein TolB [Thermodesulfovibrionales bacterium]|nr:Tol-Pal system beta propeller repeat protein TolB [Thermodesulfovibrionales bacterium]
MKENNLKKCNIVILLMGVLICSSAFAQKVYLDITSPGLFKFPIAIQQFSGEPTISEIVKEDLDYTGLFKIIDEKVHIEKNDQSFNKSNWKILGVEIVVKGFIVKRDKELVANVSVYDVLEGKEVLRKEYISTSELSRQIAHSIANDIYKLITGQQGIFRTKISYVGEKNNKKELFIMDWDGYRNYSLGIDGEAILAPKWSSDGSRLIYSKLKNRQWGIFLLDFKNLKETKILSQRGLNLAGNFLPNNREFVFVSTKEGNSDIYLGDILSMNTKKIISSPWIDVSPSVSPDAKKLLFVSNRGGTPQLYIADINGSNIRRMTFEGTYNTSPVWSPKGDKIAFVGLIEGKHQIFIMNSDGSSLVQLTHSGNNEDPSFSPDGRFIAFVSDRDGSKGVYIMRVDGGGQKRVTSKGFIANGPTWSPL